MMMSILLRSTTVENSVRVTRRARWTAKHQSGRLERSTNGTPELAGAWSARLWHGYTTVLLAQHSHLPQALSTMKRFMRQPPKTLLRKPPSCWLLRPNATEDTEEKNEEQRRTDEED